MGKCHRVREPEGRRRQDDDDPEPGASRFGAGLDVLVVDLDPQGNLTMSQGIDPERVERSMFDVLVHRRRSTR